METIKLKKLIDVGCGCIVETRGSGDVDPYFIDLEEAKEFLEVDMHRTELEEEAITNHYQLLLDDVEAIPSYCSDWFYADSKEEFRSDSDLEYRIIY